MATDGAPDDETNAVTVERSFTCNACGFPMRREVGRLQVEVSGVCHDCGDWSVQTADLETVIEAARDVAAHLAGTVLTERQALAYLLRERVGLDRQAAAEALDTSASNVDNLHRRGREKVEDAERVVGTLDALGAKPD